MLFAPACRWSMILLQLVQTVAPEVSTSFPDAQAW
jgi:hypothetical protein